MDRLRIATRGSALALAQSGVVAERLRAARPGLEVSLVPLRTSGDEGVRPAPDALGDKSDFVKEIEEALLEGRAELAVHSAKDVPGEIPDGLAIVGVPERGDPRDALCGVGSLAALPCGASVGTSSLRRRAQLLALRPDLEVRELRGNVDTRLRRLAEGAHHAVVLAAAGLERLGLAAGHAKLALAEMTPAPGQGCLALEARAGDEETASLAATLTDSDALACLTAERALVTGLAASCRTPVGGYASLHDGVLSLEAFAGLPDGGAWVRDALAGDADDPAALGRAVAERLLAAGARDILDQAELAA